MQACLLYHAGGPKPEWEWSDQISNPPPCQPSQQFEGHPVLIGLSMQDMAIDGEAPQAPALQPLPTKLHHPTPPQPRPAQPAPQQQMPPQKQKQKQQQQQQPVQGLTKSAKRRLRHQALVIQNQQQQLLQAGGPAGADPVIHHNMAGNVRPFSNASHQFSNAPGPGPGPMPPMRPPVQQYSAPVQQLPPQGPGMMSHPSQMTHPHPAPGPGSFGGFAAPGQSLPGGHGGAYGGGGPGAGSYSGMQVFDEPARMQSSAMQQVGGAFPW